MLGNCLPSLPMTGKFEGRDRPGFVHPRVPKAQHQPGHLPGAHTGTPGEPFLPSPGVEVQCVFPTKGQGHTPPGRADRETRSGLVKELTRGLEEGELPSARVCWLRLPPGHAPLLARWDAARSRNPLIKPVRLKKKKDCIQN